jgi:hypothetical protein
MGKPSPVPFPLSSFPGANPQEGAGRLINCYAEPLGEPAKPSAPSAQVWRGSSGLSQHAITGQTGYRGGLLVNNLSYEVYLNEALTVDTNGVVSLLGSFPGSKKVSIARNQASPNPNVVSVDVDNGAYNLATGGAPAAYNASGVLPQPNSVCFQDSYFFFTIASGQCYASGQNALTQNALTFITVQAKADVTLLRGIPFSGLLLLFTTGSCEVWQDAANPAPAFPYGRATVLEYGLAQQAAIAGWETGFSELMWVAQDNGVYWMTAGSLSPIKVSPPDLDRLIEVQTRAGNLLEAGCYTQGGKKFWHISSPLWTWEFNLSTKKWNERQSLNAGTYGRWRATSGHPAFGKWLVGDTLSGNLLFHDDTAFNENGAFQLFRIESGPVKEFPQQLRIARFDADFDFGTATVQGNYQMIVSGAAAGTLGVVRLTVNHTTQAHTGDEVSVSGVTGTTEANGVFPMVVVDATHIELTGTVFVNAYISGGIATDITAPPGAAAPVCAISCSKDGGRSFDNPSIRSLSPQARTKRSRASVKNRGQAGPMGVRWRIDITDPVYRGLMGATMSSDPREVSP